MVANSIVMCHISWQIKFIKLLGISDIFRPYNYMLLPSFNYAVHSSLLDPATDAEQIRLFN